MSSDATTEPSTALKVDEEHFTPTTEPQAPRNRATARPIIRRRCTTPPSPRCAWTR